MTASIYAVLQYLTSQLTYRTYSQSPLTSPSLSPVVDVAGPLKLQEARDLVYALLMLDHLGEAYREDTST